MRQTTDSGQTTTSTGPIGATGHRDAAWLRVADALRAEPGRVVVVKGWLRTRRDSKADGGLSFLAVHDGTSFDAVQVVAPASLPNYQTQIARLTTHCAVACRGTVVASQGKRGGVEIRAEAVEVIGTVEDPDSYPIQPKAHSFEYLREVAHLRARTNTFGAVARVRHCLAMAIHRFFHERGYYYVHTPIVTGSDAEGAGQMFRVSTLDMANPPRVPAPGAGGAGGGGGVDWSQDFFGKEAHLTVSGQLNVETYCCALTRVYTFGPTFRAENSNTSRHLAEFWMIEPEIAFADLHDDADVAEALIKELLATVLRERVDDMAFFEERVHKGVLENLSRIVAQPFLRVSYTEGVRVLEEAIKGGRRFEFPVQWGKDLQSEHERFLTEEHYKQPVILTNYPKAIKAFYMRLDERDALEVAGPRAPESLRALPPEQRRTVAAMDVLVPGIGEIIGGSQREERLEQLDARLVEMGLNPKDYWWYRDLRRYGTVPHAGFGLGFERLIQFVTGMQNIRDVIPFPRAPKQAEF